MRRTRCRIVSSAGNVVPPEASGITFTFKFFPLYSSITLARKYLSYYLRASHGKGHGTHSPFLYQFIRTALPDHAGVEAFAALESLRKERLQDDRELEMVDFGAGSTRHTGARRKVRALAASSLKAPKYARLLHRVARTYGCKNIVELGTSLGITTAYLAQAGADRITTFEGAPAVAALAREAFQRLSLTQVRLVEGDMNHTLPAFLTDTPPIDLVFMDGNHRKEPTLRYFQQLLPHLHEDTIVAVDDIHWSSDMEEAWAELQQHPSVTASADLFFMGFLFFRKAFRERQHIILRY